jgi:hypothetical protein
MVNKSIANSTMGANILNHAMSKLKENNASGMQTTTKFIGEG